MAEVHRLKAPWSIIEHSESFEIQDAIGQHLVYIYCEDEPARRMTLHILTKAEARVLAERICQIPDGDQTASEPPTMSRPWSISEKSGTLNVKDNAGQNLACVFFEDTAERRRATGRISHEMARRLASRIAKIGNSGRSDVTT